MLHRVFSTIYFQYYNCMVPTDYDHDPRMVRVGHLHRLFTMLVEQSFIFLMF